MIKHILIATALGLILWAMLDYILERRAKLESERHDEALAIADQVLKEDKQDVQRPARVEFRAKNMVELRSIYLQQMEGFIFGPLAERLRVQGFGLTNNWLEYDYASRLSFDQIQDACQTANYLWFLDCSFYIERMAGGGYKLIRQLHDEL